MGTGGRGEGTSVGTTPIGIGRGEGREGTTDVGRADGEGRIAMGTVEDGEGKLG